MNSRKPMQLRLPQELKEWIKAESDRNGNSQNSEVIRAIRAAKDRRSEESEGAIKILLVLNPPEEGKASQYQRIEVKVKGIKKTGHLDSHNPPLCARRPLPGTGKGSPFRRARTHGALLLEVTTSTPS